MCVGKGGKRPWRLDYHITHTYTHTHTHAHTHTQKNLIGLGVLFSGYTIAASFLYWAANYASEAIFNNWRYVLGYVVVAGLTSFAVLYRLGPVQNPRTLDLIQWSIQLVALVLVFLSCHQITEVAVAMVMVTLVSYCLPPR